MKKGKQAGQILVTYEEPVTVHEAENKRLTIALKLNEASTFIEFEVILNEIPVNMQIKYRNKTDYENESDYERGKNVVINWEFLDNFNTNNQLWVDANGLFMHEKSLWER